jgi:hypothetical protein
MGWEDDSAYSATKAVLLKDGLLSQNVTFELIQNSTQFEWSVANIALGVFVKLGGIPWAVNRPDGENEFVIGMGRSESYDPRTRERERSIAFTTCLQSNGIYEFANFGSACADKDAFMRELENTLRNTIGQMRLRKPNAAALTLHFPKDFSFDERELCKKVAADAGTSIPRIEFVKVTEEDRFFAIDDESPDQVPRRGTCIKLNNTDFLLYTEGSEERQTWVIRLYKLHGSLDWVDDEMHGICSLTFDRHPRAEDFEVSKPPLLIFGTDTKLTGKDPFLTLVHAFSEQLRTANVLVVIGYSFSDQYINEIVEQRMRDNLPMRMVLVSPRADWLKQSQPFLENSPRVSTISKGAQDALNTGLVRSEVLKLLKETKQEAPF